MIGVKARYKTGKTPTFQASLDKDYIGGSRFGNVHRRNSFVYIYSIFTLFLLHFWSCSNHGVTAQILVMRTSLDRTIDKNTEGIFICNMYAHFKNRCEYML